MLKLNICNEDSIVVSDGYCRPDVSGLIALWQHQ